MEAQQPFVPDYDYCVYCHAPAAGPCADCGALCCGDCVEVVLRFTAQRAVCQSCLAADPGRNRRRPWPWLVAALGLLIAAIALFYR